MIAIKSFRLMTPRADPRILPADAAQYAANANVDTGKVRALFKPKTVGYISNVPAGSIYRQRDGSFLDWTTAVDVIRSPLDTAPATLIYTGDGRPKIRAEGSGAAYDLGLPAPAAAPVATVVPTSANQIDISSFATRTLATEISFGETTQNEGPTTYVTECTQPIAPAQSVTVADSARVRIDVEFTTRFSVGPGGGGIMTARDVIRIRRDSQIIADVQAPDVELAHLQPRTTSISIVDAPGDGTYDYTVQILSFCPSGDKFVGYGTINASRIRVDGRMRMGTVQKHHLEATQTILINDMIASGAMSTDVNGKTFAVAEVIDDYTVDLSAFIEGEYISGGHFESYYSDAELESRNYRYTYLATINGVDYEGPASEASEGVDAGQGQGVIVTGFLTPPVDWNSPITKIRIYRYDPVSSTTGLYQFAGEIAVTDTSFTDNVLTEDLGESIPDPDMETPPETLQGIIELPNGGAAAFTGKTLYLAVPNLLHAWPAEYAKNCHDDIVAIGAFGSSIAIGTKSTPYVVTGVDPESMTMDKIELSQPCLAKAGCVDFGYAWTYPSPDGLVMIASGRAEVVTLGLFTEQQWRQLNPSSFKAARYENKYVCFYQDLDGNKGGMMFDPLNIDQGVTWLDFSVDALWTDPSDNALYLVKNNLIQKFDSDTVELAMRWRSRDFVTPLVALTAGRVEAAKYPVSVSVYCDGQEMMSAQVYSRNGFRIGNPANGQLRGEVWSVEIRSQHQVNAVYLSENMQSLGREYGGA